MSTELVTKPAAPMPALKMSEEELIGVLTNSLYPGAASGSIKMVIGYCRASGLDPMQKPVHIVPIWDGKAKQMRDVVMPGIGLYRTQAARSGEYAGVSEPEFGEDVTEKLSGVEVTYPKWCRVTVKRLLPNGTVVDFTAKELWKENYATKARDSSAPNAMWQKRPYGQIAKCAEAQALRKAFPEFGSQPTADEMEGKQMVDEYDVTPQPAEKPAAPMPRARSAKAAPAAKSANKQEPPATFDVDPETGEVIPESVQPRQQTTPQPPAQHQPSGGGAPASAGLLNVVRAKIAQANLAEADALAAFQIAAIDDIDTPTANKIIKWSQENAR